MKLAGNPLKVWNGDLVDIQQIDIGSWFGEEFSGQRVPTLAQVLEEVRGRARLVIELKYYGHAVNLEQRVIDLVESAGMENDVVLMSLKLSGVQKTKALRPDWTVGLLAATAVGDLTRLDVDFLAVSTSMAKRGFIRRAQRAGKPVFVWTVNDAVSLSSWMSQGVDGVITDEPALARQVLAQRAELSTGERLILRAATWFGVSPAPGNYRDESP
jgi:glycerophosphoryl diester phosphodiesterase